MDKSLTTRETALTGSIKVEEMLKAIVERGITSDSVAVMESLVNLYDRMKAKDAEREFNTAFASLQSATPGIVAMKGVPDKQGNIKYHYAPYQDIMEKVQPLLTKHGFSISFDTSFAEGRLTSLCTLRHVGGHSVSNKFAVRIGSGPPGATEPQADGSARSYAKRGALCDALNIVIAHDDDARTIGTPISAEKAEELKRKVRDNEINEAAFLKFAGAKEFEDISTLRLEAVEEMLNRKLR